MQRMNIIVKYLLLSVVLLGSTLVHAQSVKVGDWRTLFANTYVHSIVNTGSYIYGSMTTEAMRVEKEYNVFSNFGKKNGLSSTDISRMGYSSLNSDLIFGYADGNIDIVTSNDVYNIDDIKDKNIGGNKQIYNIFSQGRYSYLACGFGIVVLDMQKLEIKETYFIGENNTNLAVYDITIDDKYIYAATEKGLKYADKDAVNLNDFSFWRTDSIIGEREVNSCEVLNDSLVLVVPDIDTNINVIIDTIINTSFDTIRNPPIDTIIDTSFDTIRDTVINTSYKLSDTDKIFIGHADKAWKTYRENEYLEIQNIIVYNEYFIICNYSTTEKLWKVTAFDKNNIYGEPIFNVSYTGDKVLSTPYDALIDRAGDLWVACGFGRIFKHTKAGERTTYQNKGPYSNNSFRLNCFDDMLLQVGGGYGNVFASNYNGFDFSTLSGDYWKQYNKHVGYSELDRKIAAIEAVKVGDNHYFVATSGSGLVEIKDDKDFTFYNNSNSTLKHTSSTSELCLVHGLALDANKNIWMTNPWAENALSVRRNNGEWQSYNILPLIGGEQAQINKIMVDYWNTKWIINGTSRLFVFREDGARMNGLRIDMNNGSSDGTSIETSKVFCVLEDEDGIVWIGTDRGIKIISTHATLFNNPNGSFSSAEVRSILVPIGDGIHSTQLLKNDQVSSIVIDGGNRKWIGTFSGGLYLVSESGGEVIEQFTIENSPLLSNNILSLAYNKKTGMLYIATDKGLISYRTKSTFAPSEEEKLEAIAFPNPVKPGYQGYISVKNLPFNADVKITDAAGRLIYKGKAVGGQISWDGYNMQGKRPDSGVLLVFAASIDGNSKVQKMVTKIFFVR